MRALGFLLKTCQEIIGALVAGPASHISPKNKLPAMSYYDAFNGDLKFAAFDGTKWSAQTVAAKGTVGLYSNLRIKPDGTADILF